MHRSPRVPHLTGCSLIVVVGVVSLVAGSPASATRNPHATTSPATVWLCRPGAPDDPCASDLAMTSVPSSGSTTPATEQRSASASKFDCFYVYPTVSEQPSANASLKFGLAQITVAKAQAAPFSSLCRVWAPVYRQRTILSLAAGLGTDPAANAVAYQSVASAWADYLAHDNDGRPFVLIGHSQGAAMLILLLRHDIDQDPALRSRLVSAIIAGGNVQVPSGRLVGGSFAHIPACSSANETGCVIAYSSFPSTPPTDSLFGRPGTGVSLQSGQTTVKGQQVLCTNPASLRGGSGALVPEFLTSAVALSGVTVTTPWVEFPGLYRAQCEHSGGATWLDVTTPRGAAGHRPTVTERDGPQWGYHADDVSLALGNLLADVNAQEAAYASAQ